MTKTLTKRMRERTEREKVTKEVEGHRICCPIGMSRWVEVRRGRSGQRHEAMLERREGRDLSRQLLSLLMKVEMMEEQERYDAQGGHRHVVREGVGLDVGGGSESSGNPVH